MITIKARRLASEAWQMTLVDEAGYYVGSVISPWEDVARRMAEAAAKEVIRFGRVGHSTPPAKREVQSLTPRP